MPDRCRTRRHCRLHIVYAVRMRSFGEYSCAHTKPVSVCTLCVAYTSTQPSYDCYHRRLPLHTLFAGSPPGLPTALLRTGQHTSTRR